MASEQSLYLQSRNGGSLFLRRGLIDLAKGLLSTEGPEALTLRRLAHAAGCSTKVIYANFGGKSGVAEALYRSAFETVRQHFQTVPEDISPLERIRLLALAYRNFALAEPEMYGLMYERTIPGYTPSADAIRTAADTFALVLQPIEDCIRNGSLIVNDSEEIVRKLWATQHGHISLALSGYIVPEESEEEYISLVEGVLTRYRKLDNK